MEEGPGVTDAPDETTAPHGPSGDDRGGFAAWWAAHRDRASILAIGGLALGGIVCMFLTVLVIVLA